MRRYAWVVFLAVLLALYLSFVYAPTERVMGEVQRLMYFHVASAWNAFLAFAVVAFGGVQYLRTGEPRWDRLAYASGEIGVFFTTIALASGSVWARAAWGTWWTWEPRLTTTAILWFMYLGYLLIRAAAEGNESQARLASVFGIIAFVDVPIVFLSIRWWRGMHPSQIEMDPRMGLALGVSVLAFTLLYAYLLDRRVRLENLRHDVNVLKEELR